MPDITVSFFLSQLLAATAFISGIIAFQQSERRDMLKFWFISALLNASHFAVLQQTEAALFVALTAIRFLVAAWKPSQLFMWLFLSAATAVFILSYQSPLNTLPYIAAVVGTVGSFQHKLGLVRGLMAIGAGCWIIHNMLVGSPVAVLMELAFLSSNLVGYLRSRRHSA